MQLVVSKSDKAENEKPRPKFSKSTLQEAEEIEQKVG